MPSSNDSFPATNSLCRKCGKEALDACGNCKSAFYCSKRCQEWDWKKGGHKSLCRGSDTNRKIHIILRELFVAEYAWLKSLSEREKDELLCDRYRNVPLNHVFVSGEVALVLARGTACAVLSNAGMHAPGFGLEYYQKVLEPWYKSHQDFLNEQGFVVDLIEHEVRLADRLCRCGDNGESCGKIVEDMDAPSAIIRDTRSCRAALVEKVMLQERPQLLEDWTEEEKTNVATDFVKCISFPATKITSDRETGVAYTFRYPKQVFGGSDVCCSAALKLRFPVSDKDATALGEHFCECHQAMRAIGFPLMLDIKEPEEWSNKALAETFLAGAGDADTFHYWADESRHPFVVRMSDDRFDDIGDMMYDVEEGLYDEEDLREKDIELCHESSFL